MVTLRCSSGVPFTTQRKTAWGESPGMSDGSQCLHRKSLKSLQMMQKLGCSSAAECLPGMHKVLGWSLSIGRE